MSCESFILLHEMQTKLMAFDKLKKESPAKQLARKAKALLDNEATIIQCTNDDCYGGYIISYCDCLNDPKCSRCNGKGVIQVRCDVCKGQGEVLAYPDGRREPLI